MSDSPADLSAQNGDLQAFQQWKARLKRLLAEYFAWLKGQQLLSPVLEAQLGADLLALNRDEITMALVAECSRGKSNLLNAIFFADHGRHFLPSSVGRTTMCPVEIHHDVDRPEPCLRLLPIETLLDDRSLGSLKETPEVWDERLLERENPEQMQRLLQEVKLTRSVSLEEASRLGLVRMGDAAVQVSEAAIPHGQPASVQMEVPKWRHALLNVPHPWLQQGLRILDTPGLNALGAEPELLLRILPSAQVIVFVLGIDTGVAQSDLHIWQTHIKAHRQQQGQGLLVVLNKIDSLWSELATADEIQAAIDQQVQDTARALELPVERIFPVSAHKALVARIKGDQALLEQSGILAFERHLFHTLVQGRYGFLVQTLCAGLEQMLDQQSHLFQTRLLAMKQQRSDLFQLSDKSSRMLAELSSSLLLEKQRYMQTLDAVTTCRQALEAKSRELAQILDPEVIGALIHEAEAQMRASWTTLGLQKAMQGLFDRLNVQILIAANKVDEIKELVLGLYHWLEHQEGYSLVQPRGFSIIKYRAGLDRLHQEAEQFRRGARLLASGKNQVIHRFLNTLVQEAQLLFEKAAMDACTSWVKLAMEPILYQVRDHKDMLDRKALDLRKISQSREALVQRVKELHGDMAQTMKAVKRLQRFKADNAELMGMAASVEHETDVG